MADATTFLKAVTRIHERETEVGCRYTHCIGPSKYYQRSYDLIIFYRFLSIYTDYIRCVSPYYASAKVDSCRNHHCAAHKRVYKIARYWKDLRGGAISRNHGKTTKKIAGRPSDTTYLESTFTGVEARSRKLRSRCDFGQCLNIDKVGVTN